MKTNILAIATRTRACPSLAREYGRKNAMITITAQAYQLGGNAHPHFSVTADIYAPGKSHDPFACGCLHDEALRFWPAIKPIIALHLSNADDGEPMHAEANGWYNMAGALGGMGEKYHRGNSPMNFPCTAPADKPWMNTEHRNPTPDECLAMLAEHLRISMEQAQMLRDSLKDSTNPRAFFGAFVEAQRERWQKEAEAGLALIRSLSQETESIAA